MSVILEAAEKGIVNEEELKEIFDKKFEHIKNNIETIIKDDRAFGQLCTCWYMRYSEFISLYGEIGREAFLETMMTADDIMSKIMLKLGMPADES